MNTILLSDFGNKRRRVEVSAIEYLEGDENYAHIHFVSGTKMCVAMHLKKLEDRLPGFLRIHKRYLVNPKHVKSFSAVLNQSNVGLSRNRFLPMARRRVNDLKPQLSDLCKLSSTAKA